MVKSKSRKPKSVLKTRSKKKIVKSRARKTGRGKSRSSRGRSRAGSLGVNILPKIMKNLSSNPMSGSSNPTLSFIMRFNAPAQTGEYASIDLGIIRAQIAMHNQLAANDNYHFYLNSVKVYGSEVNSAFVAVMDEKTGIAGRDDPGTGINRAAVGMSYPPDARVVYHSSKEDGATKIFSTATTEDGPPPLIHLSATMWHTAKPA